MKKFDSFLNYFVAIGVGLLIFLVLLRMVCPEIFGGEPSAATLLRNGPYNQWGSFVKASDTVYINGELAVFDTINFVYIPVATVTIHPIK